MEYTESCWMVRSAWKVDCEYLFELHTEQKLVGCDGCDRYIARVLSNRNLLYNVPDKAGNASCL